MPCLPPLPPTSRLSSHFLTRYLAASPNPTVMRKSPGRVLLTNPTLTDQFTRALGIREGEVIIEGYAGIGSLTRSLVSGGDAVGEGQEWEQTDQRVVKGGKPTGSRTTVSKKFPFPRWIDDLPALSNSSSLGPPIRKPKLVLATEGSLEILHRGFDFPEDKRQKPVLAQTDTLSKDQEAAMSEIPEAPLVKSPHADNLFLQHSTVYGWSVAPSLLQEPVVSAALPVWDPKAGKGQTTKRPWEAPPPPITFVATLPDSPFGEQLLSQWVRSAVGDLGQRKSWIWEWGRVRIALLIGKAHYDRLMAQPGDAVHNKLSIFTQALFHTTPLPPYHHVFNVDKRAKLTESIPQNPCKYPKCDMTPHGYSPMEPRPEYLAEISNTRTVCVPTDFYPGPYSSKKPYPRPPMLGVLLTPRLHSRIPAEQKDAWDYVLRRLFVRDTATLEQAIFNLSFGADRLLPLIEGTQPREGGGEYRGVNVDRRRGVRYLDLDEWSRIVDVFDHWVFRPENLLTPDEGLEDETSRQIGTD
ncbi:uncharacterized protein L203_101783 [Cryptococcus depauperatus CBS 7841]|uniref:rRNA adenine N(6)-methyltransferase n=1 Tax=Cryptococcus depauperatus CBS 7841 TaxID=1295531 RepID=A0A1E3IGU4_9TREE|nr:hypothetical protein L203_03021 [Cryptococcus depauperatus CBS 7841]